MFTCSDFTAMVMLESLYVIDSEDIVVLLLLKVKYLNSYQNLMKKYYKNRYNNRLYYIIGLI